MAKRGAPLGSELVLPKLVPPTSARDALRRPRLIEQVSKRLLRKLTLVLAPAGFGKTTFMCQLREELERRRVQTCWVSLGAEEATPTEFLTYLLGALSTIEQDIGSKARQLLRGRGTTGASQIISRLLNELVGEDRPIAVFLDDYHLAESPGVAELMIRLLDRAVGSLHFVIGSRVSPQLPIAQLRAYGDVSLFGSEDLRFDELEGRRFIEEYCGRPVRPDQLAVLQQRTEGWPAGLQLALLALQTSHDWDQFIQSFSGDSRDVSDYLLSDVFLSLSQREQNFLLRTSLLDRMNAELCTLLTSDPDAQELLEDLERRNLFLFNMDQKRIWYRYHHLFQDFLVARLRSRMPAEVPQLLELASSWFASQQLVSEAMSYAFKGTDYDRVADLLSDFAPKLLRDGQMNRLLDWIQKIPDEIVRERPQLSLLECWALFHMQQAEAAAAALATAERALSERGVDGSRARSWLPGGPPLDREILVLRAGIAVARDDPDRVLELAALLGPAGFQSLWLEATFSNILGYAHVAAGSFAEAERLLIRAGEAHRANESPFGQTYAICFLGMSYLARGELNRAEALLTQAEEMATAALGERTPAVATPRVLRAALAFERGDLAEAEELIAERQLLLNDCGLVEIEALGALTLARIHAARGRTDDYIAIVRERTGASDRGRPRQRIRIALDWLQFHLRSGDHHAAQRMAAGEEFEPLRNYRSLERWDRVAFAHSYAGLLLREAQGDHAEVLAFASLMLADVERLERRSWTIPLQLVRAAAAAALGREQLFCEAMEAALERAQSERFVQTILQFPFDAGNLLRQFGRIAGEPRLAEAQAYARGLLLKADLLTPRNNATAGSSTGLSDRELEVLRLIASGGGNRAISATLNIAENTVKWHLKNIFEKLGVTNRTAAARYFTEFELMPPKRVG